MTVGPQEYREAMSKLAGGVTIVTVSHEGELRGMTATAFAAVSLDPPLVLVCLEKTSRTRELILSEMNFVANVLSTEQLDIATRFSRRGTKSFDDLAFEAGEEGAPRLDGVLAWVECTVREVIDAGDHDIAIGEVVACRAAPGEPLLYFDRAYRSLPSGSTISESPGRSSGGTAPAGSSSA
jgi:flavin reductase (DIM6/NTAB) family NADH-FMN oxidoreductase RutF